MDRSSRYINKMNGQSFKEASSALKSERANAYGEAGYRDYFAEAVAFICRLLSHYAFRFAASAVGFALALVFTLGVVGGIELEVLSLACGIPLCVMLLCALTLLYRVRK